MPKMYDIFFKTIAFFCRVASTNTHSMSPRSGCWTIIIIIIIIYIIIVVVVVKTCLQIRRLCSKLCLASVSFLL